MIHCLFMNRVNYAQTLQTPYELQSVVSRTKPAPSSNLLQSGYRLAPQRASSPPGMGEHHRSLLRDGYCRRRVEPEPERPTAVLGGRA